MNVRRLPVTLFAAAAFVALTAPAHAEDAWGDGVEVMADNEMQSLRGGIRVNGIDIGFGAVVTTYVNNMPVLSTQLTLTDAGAIVSETLGNVGQQLSDLSTDQLDALGLGGLENAGGVVIEDEAGVTALVHNVTDGALQNIIINNATGRDLRQDIDVTLTLPGFEMIQDSLFGERMGIRLGDELSGYLYDPVS
jgi:hypothetical protein